MTYAKTGLLSPSESSPLPRLTDGGDKAKD